MSRPTLWELRKAVKTTIANYCTVPLNQYGVVEDMGETPAVIVEPRSADYEGAFGGRSDVWSFNLFVVVARTDADSNYAELDELISGSGDGSIVTALRDHSDLGIDGVTATVKSMTGYGGSFQWYGEPHTGAILRVEILVD
jgi:hypothetical protein